MPVLAIPVDAVKRSEIVFPTLESPVLNVRTDSFELNVFQSVLERYPLVPVVACPIENTPVVLLYASGPDAESAVSPILPLIAVS